MDEAHRCTNPRSASAKLAKALRTRYLLLLTATPVQNRLDDLFQLVSLIAPGLLGPPRSSAPATAARRPRGRSATWPGSSRGCGR